MSSWRRIIAGDDPIDWLPFGWQRDWALLDDEIVGVSLLERRCGHVSKVVALFLLAPEAANHQEVSPKPAENGHNGGERGNRRLSVANPQ